MNNKESYSLYHKCGAVALIISLLWLTISTPFVFNMQQAIDTEQAASGNNQGGQDDTPNPLNNSEEKAPTTTNLSEEYLHNHEGADDLLSSCLSYHCPGDDGTYIAYHGELLVPPPDAA